MDVVGVKAKSFGQEECTERILLVEEYSRCVTDYTRSLEALKRPTGERGEVNWRTAERTLAESQKAWEALEQHITEHQCLVLHWASRDSADPASSQILGAAAAAALDMILVVDDNRRFIDVNEAAAHILELPRSEIVGRSIDEFFSEARGEAIPAAWESFISEGVQGGVCELRASGRRRRFEYRARANFASGLHLSVLREQPETGDR